MKTLITLTGMMLFMHITMAAQIEFDIKQFTNEVTERLESHLVESIEEQIKAAEAVVIKKTLIKEMLEPYKDYGIDADNVQIYDSIKSIYESLRDDENFDPKAEIKSKIRDMVKTKIYNSVVPSFIDKESIEIASQLQGLAKTAKQRLQKINDAYENIAQIPVDADDYETQVTDAIRKIGFKGAITDKIEDLEVFFGAAYDKYAQPIEILSAVVDGVSSDDPTYKIEVLFNMGSNFGSQIPMVGDIVSSLFDIGKELLAATKRTGGLLERNLGQGCIASDGEFNQATKLKQQFYQKFPHIYRACPLNLSKTSGVYRNIYYNENNENELIFLYKNRWLGGKVDSSHAGVSDIKALRIWLKSVAENTKAGELSFLHAAYYKTPGFLGYRRQVSAKLATIKQLSQNFLGAIAYCNDAATKDFVMDTLGLNWLSKLMKGHGDFDFDDVKYFSSYTLDALLNQMLKNKYLARNHSNLDRLDGIIASMRDKQPIRIYGKVTSGGKAIKGASLGFSQTLILQSNRCFNNETDQQGKYNLFAALNEGYRSTTETLNVQYQGKNKNISLTIDLNRQTEYQQNISLLDYEGEKDKDSAVIDSLIMTPKHANLSIGESITFTVLAQLNNGNIEDVSSVALNDNTFTATNIGQFNVKANYQGLTTTASIEVSGNQACEDYPGTILVWNEATQSAGCVCQDDKDWSEALKKCASPKEDALASTDCSAYGVNAQAVWDDVNKQANCECMQGFRFDKNNVCQPIRNKDCSQYPGMQATLDQSTGQQVCACQGNEKWSDYLHKCATSKANEMATSDCSFLGTYAKVIWDPAAQHAACDCVAGYQLNANNDQCVVITSEDDCAQYPGTQLVNGACECPGKLEFSYTQNRCVKNADLTASDIDCTAYPGAIPQWDAAQNSWTCRCLGRKKWSITLNSCAYAEDEAVASSDCSSFKGTTAVYDDFAGGVVCKCIDSGMIVSDSKGRCMTPQDAAVADLDCSAFGKGAVSVFDKYIHQAVCQCQSGYSMNTAGSLCVADTPVSIPNNQGPLMTPDIIKPGQCGVLYDKGGNEPESYVFQVGNYNSISLFYDTYNVKDNVSVLTASRQMIWNSGCVGQKNTQNITIPAGSSEVIIDIHPNCSGTTGTGWEFKATCQ